MRLTKWIQLYENPNYKSLSPKQWKKYKERERKLIDEFIKSGETDLDYLSTDNLTEQSVGYIKIIYP